MAAKDYSENGAMSRRNVLLAGTTFAAASVAASVNAVYAAEGP